MQRKKKRNARGLLADLQQLPLDQDFTEHMIPFGPACPYTVPGKVSIL